MKVRHQPPPPLRRCNNSQALYETKRRIPSRSPAFLLYKENDSVLSEFSLARSARERNDVTDVGHAGNKEHQTFESETEAGVRH